jgi:hypothetical protein
LCCARFLVVGVADGLCLLILFNLDMRDKYATDPSAVMFSGLSPLTSLTSEGCVLVAVYCGVVSLCTVSGFLVDRWIKRKARRAEQQQKDASRQTKSLDNEFMGRASVMMENEDENPSPVQNSAVVC